MDDAPAPALRIRACFYREAAPEWHVDEHHHDIHQWYCCLHGSLRVRVGGAVHVLAPERSVLVPPLARRAVACAGRAPGYVVAIFAPIALDLAPITGPVLRLPAPLRSDLHALVDELRHPGEDGRLLVPALLARLLIGHKRALAAPAPAVSALNAASHGGVAAAAERYLLDHLAEPVRRAAVARAVHLSEPHLGRIYRAATGRTLLQRLAELRIEAAKRLLLESTLSVTQVAGAVGIVSFSHFARVFKRQVGVTPGDYRRSGGNAYL